MQTLPRTGSSARPSAPRHLGGVGLGTILAAFLMVMMDTFIVNVAAPTLRDELHLGSAELELVVAGYTIATTLTLVLAGRLGDMYGRRKVLIIGIAGFTVASLLCGIATSGAELIAFRVIQGIFGAFLPTAVLGTITATTTGEMRSRAMGIYAATSGMALAIGQILGGVLLHLDIAGTTWRPLFFVNIPIGIITLALIRFVPESRSDHKTTLDVWGTLLLGGTLLCLLLPINQGQSLGWPWWLWPILAVSVVFAVALWRYSVRAEKTGATPLLMPSLVRLPLVHRSLLIACLFFAGFASFVFISALLIQQYLHHSALTSALSTLPMALAFFAGSLCAPRLWARFGHRMVFIGASVQGLGLLTMIVAVLTQWPDVSLWSLVPGMALAGAGQSCIFGSMLRIALEPVPAHLAGVGSGMFTTTQQAGLASGVAILGTIFTTVVASHSPATAFAITTGIQVAIAVVVAAATPLLRQRL